MKIMMPIVALVIALFSVGVVANVENSSKVGDNAADFSITRLDGSTFKLSDYRGKKAVKLIFWATWCPNCKAEIPALNALHEKHGNDIELLAINVTVNDSLRRVEHYQKKYNLAYPLAFDEGQNVSRAYNVMGTPTLIIIDINGVIRYRASETPEDIGEHLDLLMGR